LAEVDNAVVAEEGSKRGYLKRRSGQLHQRIQLGGFQGRSRQIDAALFRCPRLCGQLDDGHFHGASAHVERGSGPAYDEACRALVDISEACALLANKKQFEKELKKFMAAHMRRRALIQRLVKAGIWEDE
jgi:hypothetical protein